MLFSFFFETPISIPGHGEGAGGSGSLQGPLWAF